MAIEGKQVRNGKAFEYAIAMEYYSYLLKKGKNVQIELNNAKAVAQGYFEEFSEQEQGKFKQAARNTIDTMVKIEPALTEQADDKDTLTISLNEDSAGEGGDVRDVVFQRSGSAWEIGFSAKNNNDAVKHSRLAKNLDFGQVWLGIPCSASYWGAVKPIFAYLESQAKHHALWTDLGEGKKSKVYMPLLTAFKNELLEINRANSYVPEKLIKYLIGNRPFYKIIKDDVHNLVIVKAFNINGELNRPYNNVRSAYSTPKVNLPRRIVEFEFKEDSDTTLNMILDGGWEASFRLHNASRLVEPSLKFDIQLLGNPPILFTQHIFQ